MSRRFRHKPLALAVLLVFSPIAPVFAQDAEVVAELPGITVLGQGDAGATLSSYSVSKAPAGTLVDSAQLLTAAPGVAVVRNGEQTGIVQLRGLFGERVKVSLDGMNITPACPNHMDPPLHYALPGQVETMQVVAGVTPVSQGGDSIAGTVVVSTVPQDLFAAPGFHGQLGAEYSGANDGQAYTAVANVATEQSALRYRGSYIKGRDMRFPGGTVKDTGYETSQNGVTLATKLGDAHALTLDASRHDTRNAGTPALPMDMISDGADSVRAELKGKHVWGQLSLEAYQHDIAHLMDNYTLRSTSGMRMRAPATSDDSGLAARVVLPRDGKTYRAGVEWFGNEFNAWQQNMSMMSQPIQTMFNNATRKRLGVYGEVEQQHGANWSSLLGLRSDTVAMNAGAISQYFGANAAAAAAFNAAGRSKTDSNWDAIALARYRVDASTAYEFGFARKTRSPSVLERYLWSASNASAGQADGRTYLGNLNLKPEVSNQLSASAEWKQADWRVKPTLFYQRVEGFIQGTPTSMLDSSGSPVLQYQNVNAELYGIDGEWARKLSSTWALDGTVSYVRGKNRDNGDNLYRLAPLHASLNAVYDGGSWQQRIEWQLASRQNRVSAYNGETPTGGYGIVNWQMRYPLGKAVRLTVGVNNLFDRYYVDHLGGVNRVSGSDVPVGGKIPSPGRYGYVNVNWTW